MHAETLAVTRVVRAFADCWNAHDMKAFGDLFASDAEFVDVVGLWWNGRAAIRDAHTFTHRTIFKRSRLTLDDMSLRWPAPHVALARCRWTLAGHVASDGTPLPERRGILLNVLRKDGDRWRIIDAQNTDVIPGELSRPP